METNTENIHRQKMIPTTYRVHNLVKMIAKRNKRTLTAQIEAMAEEECTRLGIEIPTELTGVKSL